MSSVTTFQCDFCGNSLVNKGTNADKVGWTLARNHDQEYEWTNVLFKQLHGPHICEDCICGVKKAAGIK